MNKWQEKGSSPKLPSWNRAQAAPRLTKCFPRGSAGAQPPGETQLPRLTGTPLPTHQTHTGTQTHPKQISTHTCAHAVACSLTHCHHHHGLATPPLNTVTHRSQAESHTPGCTTIIIAGAQESHTLSLPPRGHGSTHPRHSPPRLAADLLGDVQEDVRAAVGRGNEAVALGPTEAFADSFVDRAL